MKADQDLFPFQWPVVSPKSSEKYQWVTARPDPDHARSVGIRRKKQRYLETHPLTSVGARTKEGVWFASGTVYEPDSGFTGRILQPLRDDKALFHHFAALEPDESEILEFATQYGHLGIDHPIDLPKDLDRPWEVRTGEPFEEWELEIAIMDDTVTVWRHYMAGDERWLKRRFHWKRSEIAEVALRFIREGRRRSPRTIPAESRKWYKSKELWYMPPDERFKTLVFYPGSTPELHQLIRPWDVIRPALVYVQKVVNYQLRRLTSVQLLWNDPSDDTPEIRIHPSNLLGAMWVQFSKAVEGGFEYVQCHRRKCKKWRRLQRKAPPGTKHWCTKEGSCRILEYRERKEKARDLYREGLKPAEIAKAVETELKVVRDWLRRKR